MLRLLRCCAAALLALGVLASTRLHAEDAYPTRPIRLKKLVEMGFEPMLDLATDKADDFVRREQARWLPVLKATPKAE